jgi:hypothetical protein
VVLDAAMLRAQHGGATPCCVEHVMYYFPTKVCTWQCNCLQCASSLPSWHVLSACAAAVCALFGEFVTNCSLILKNVFMCPAAADDSAWGTLPCCANADLHGDSLLVSHCNCHIWGAGFIGCSGLHICNLVSSKELSVDSCSQFSVLT